jgi:asparagine synthase (glutamine-hydrolysing)
MTFEATQPIRQPSTCVPRSADDTRAGFRIDVPRNGAPPEVAEIRTGPRCASATRGVLRLLVLGEVIGEHGPLAPEAVLDRYAAEGSACVHGLDGAFLIVAVHAERGDVVVFTDRVNALKCFVEERPDVIVLVSSLRLLPDRPRAFDAVAGVSFLTNAALLGGRTIFEGVRVLHRASVHVVAARGITYREYESFRFDVARTGCCAEDLRDELAYLVLRAVSRRLPTPAPLVLSLSGGDQSTAILGCLARLGRRDVGCFSYSYHPDDPLSEAAVSRGLASAVGFTHAHARSFSGDLDGFIDRNVERAECRANLCLELEAWRPHADLPAEAVLLTGEGAFGWAADDGLGTTADALSAVPLYGARELGHLAARLGLGDAARLFDEELNALASAGAHADALDTRDFLVLDQRIPSLLMPWRELFPRRPVRAPLLDREILAFLTRVPATYRSGRRLFKETVYDMFPELFGRDRTSRAAEPWSDAVVRHRVALEAELRTTSSPVDGWLRPDVVCSLLNDVVQATSARQSPVRAPRRPEGHAAAARHRGRPALASPVQLFLRIVALRRFAMRCAVG